MSAALDGITGGFRFDLIVPYAIKMIDVEAVAGISRNTASRGVRLGDEAEAFETGHFGADGSRRDTKKFSQSYATDRRGGFGVFLDDLAKNLLLAFSDFHIYNYTKLALKCKDC